MPTFQYRAVSVEGSALSGEISAADRKSAAARLQAQGHTPLSITELKPGSLQALLSRDLFAGEHLGAGALVKLIQQLSVLLGAGILVEDGLALLAGREGAPKTRRLLQELLRRLRGGSGLADAMATEAKSFPSVVIAMVRAGEASGALDSVLARLAEYLRRSEAARQTVRSALIYPTILAVTALSSVILILTVVLPQLEPLLRDAGPALPPQARLVFGASDLLRRWWWAFLAILGAVGYGLWRGWGEPANAVRRDRLLLRLPLLGAAIRQAQTARFARTLGALVGGGVALPTALALARPVISNHVMADAVTRVSSQLREGGGLAEPLARTGVFPDLSIQLIRIGEATGKLDQMLLQQAEIFDEEVRLVLGRALTLLVPVLTVTLGFIVAGIIASVMSAMLSINNLAG
jgi:general secretion pathway protein F